MDTIENFASEFAGNWQRFQSFGSRDFRDVPDPDNWGIFYTHNRDSRLLELSNASVYESKLDTFADADDDNPDAFAIRHGNWACGWIDGYAVRVRRTDGEFTDAFQALYGIQSRLADYPVLDEDDYSRREYEATLENIVDVGRRLDDEFELPEEWVGEVFSWLWQHNQAAVESRDDSGGYPSKDDIREAFVGLGYPETSAIDDE